MKARAVDVAIVGASLGGASAARRLAKRGISVTLFDRVAFPRRKACGEGLSIQGMDELGQLGLAEPLASLAAIPFYGFRFFEKRKQSEIVLHPHTHGIGVRRSDLDSLLVASAQQSGASVHVGGDVKVSRRRLNEFWIETADGSWRARYLVLATGANSALPESLGVPTFSRRQSRCGLSIPLKHRNAHNQTTVDIFVNPKTQACSTPVDHETTTLSLFCSNDEAKRLTPSQIPFLVADVCDRFGIEAYPSDTGLTVSGLGRVYRSSVHDSIFVIGDAYRQLDPIGGMGMTQALVTARLAAETIVSLMNASDARVPAILRDHEFKVQRAVRKLVGYTALTYWSLSTALGRRTLGTQKVGGLAREVLLSMHRPARLRTPYGLISTLLIKSAGSW